MILPNQWETRVIQTGFGLDTLAEIWLRTFDDYSGDEKKIDVIPVYESDDPTSISFHFTESYPRCHQKTAKTNDLLYLFYSGSLFKSLNDIFRENVYIQ